MAVSKREERALFRGELLAEQRAQTVALRRIAAVLELESTVKGIDEEKSCGS